MSATGRSEGLTESVKFTLAKEGVTAGVTNIEDAEIIDMAGFDAVAFAVICDTPASGTAKVTVKVEQSDASNMADEDDLAGLISEYEIANDADEEVLIVDLIRPAKRYVRCVVDRADEDVAIGGILAMQYAARSKPVTQDDSVEHELTANPAVVV